MTVELHPLPHALLGLLGLVAIVYDVKTRSLPDWLTFGGIACGLILGAVLGGWEGFLTAVYGGACGLIVFWLLWSLGMMGFGDVLLMAACGALLGWPLVTYGLLYATVAGALLGLVYSAVRGHLGRVFRNLFTAVATTLNPRRKRVPLAELPTDEIPYAVGIVIGAGLASLIPYVPALRLV